jgi:VWFA-related protein
MSTRYGSWIGIFCFSLTSGFAQQNGPAAVVPLGGADRRITLDVVVTDKSGRPIPGLQQQDFTLLDDKRPEKILSFRAVEGAAAREDQPVEVILLVDEVNTSFSRVATERDQIEKFLRQNGGKLARPVSMMFVSDLGTKIEETPSQDGNALAADLSRKWTGLRTVNRSQGIYGVDERVKLSLKALQQLVDYEGPRPGRKLVVWISPGWPFLSGPGADLQMTAKRQQGIFSSIVGFSDALRSARITLYAVDPLGVEDAAGFQTSRYRDFLKPVKAEGQAQNGNMALQVLASQSGGLVINSSNDVAGEIATCVADANAFYVLSFDRPAADGPNEYHALDIKIGKPGLAARTRSGYYAQPEPRRQ